MNTRSIFGLLSLILLFTLSGCLTCETKTYSFQFTGKGKGRLTMTYHNIFSKSTEEDMSAEDELAIDFDELIFDYMNGDKLLEAYPDAKVISRRLFESNGKLNGEVVYEFSDISQVHLFQTHAKGPYMYLLNSFSFETATWSNGKIGPQYFNAIYWPSKLKKLEFTTSVDSFDSSGTSLLTLWKSMNK